MPNTFVSHCMQPLYLIRHDLKAPPPTIYPKLQTIHFMVGFGILATYTGRMQVPNANELPLKYTVQDSPIVLTVVWGIYFKD